MRFSFFLFLCLLVSSFSCASTHTSKRYVDEKDNQIKTLVHEIGAELNSHIVKRNNPHNVNAEQVGAVSTNGYNRVSEYWKLYCGPESLSGNTILSRDGIEVNSFIEKTFLNGHEIGFSCREGVQGDTLQLKISRNGFSYSGGGYPYGFFSTLFTFPRLSTDRAVIAVRDDIAAAIVSATNSITASQVGAVPVTGYDAQGPFHLSTRALGSESYFGETIWQEQSVQGRKFGAGFFSGLLQIEDYGKRSSDGWRRIVYGPYNLRIMDQRPGGQQVEMELLLPSVRAGTEQLAVVSDIDRRKGYTWDEEAGVLWMTQIRNGYLEIVAITNRPLAEL